MKQLRMRTVQRQDDRAKRAASIHFDKAIYRLPSPFYRGANMKVMAGPGAKRIVLISTSELWNDGVHMGFKSVTVKGWMVERMDGLVGYFITQSVRGIDVTGFETLQRQSLDVDDEGVRWARGWEEETRVALEVAFALS